MLCGNEFVSFADLERALLDSKQVLGPDVMSSLQESHMLEILQSKKRTSPQLDFEDAIKRFGRWNCRDPRDRIFGLLYFVAWPENGPAPLIADYSLERRRLAMLSFPHCTTVSGIGAICDALALDTAGREGNLRAAFECCSDFDEICYMKKKLDVQVIDDSNTARAAVRACSARQEVLTVLRWLSMEVKSDERLQVMCENMRLWSNIHEIFRVLDIQIISSLSTAAAATRACSTREEAFTVCERLSNRLTGSDRLQVMHIGMPLWSKIDDMQRVLNIQATGDLEIARATMQMCSPEDDPLTVCAWLTKLLTAGERLQLVCESRPRWSCLRGIQDVFGALGSTQDFTVADPHDKSANSTTSAFEDAIGVPERSELLLAALAYVKTDEDIKRLVRLLHLPGLGLEHAQRFVSYFRCQENREIHDGNETYSPWDGRSSQFVPKLALILHNLDANVNDTDRLRLALDFLGDQWITEDVALILRALKIPTTYSFEKALKVTFCSPIVCLRRLVVLSQALIHEVNMKIIEVSPDPNSIFWPPSLKDMDRELKTIDGRRTIKQDREPILVPSWIQDTYYLSFCGAVTVVRYAPPGRNREYNFAGRRPSSLGSEGVCLLGRFGNMWFVTQSIPTSTTIRRLVAVTSFENDEWVSIRDQTASRTTLRVCSTSIYLSKHDFQVLVRVLRHAPHERGREIYESFGNNSWAKVTERRTSRGTVKTRPFLYPSCRNTCNCWRNHEVDECQDESADSLGDRDDGSTDEEE